MIVPITKSAKKALRQSFRKAAMNRPVRSAARTLLKKARTTPTIETLSAAFSALDKAVKKNLMHKNTVSRYKSRLAKMIAAK